MDGHSLLTWLEARKLVLETGNRFQIRIQYYVTFFLVLMCAMLLLYFAVFSAFVSYTVMTFEQWISFTSLTLFLLVLIMMVLLPNSFLNEECML